MKKMIVSALAISMWTCGVASASVPAVCQNIRIAFVGGPDNQVQNAVFSTIAHDIGYHVSSNFYSEAILYAGMKNNQIDVFLDDWKPSMDNTTAPYIKSHAIDVIGPDLTGAKYTLAVPDYLYKQGLHSFGDVQRFGKQLGYKIYGIEPGTAANGKLLTMIKDNTFGLGKFHLVQSSETGMFSELSRKYNKKSDIVFLGWEPAPMNVQFHIRYLSGGHAYFGHDKGAATVFANTRAGYAKACPEIGRLLRNFKLSVTAENKMMYQLSVKHKSASVVAADWLQQNPGWISSTLSGVTATDGKPAAAIVLSKSKA